VSKVGIGIFGGLETIFKAHQKNKKIGNGELYDFFIGQTVPLELDWIAKDKFALDLNLDGASLYIELSEADLRKLYFALKEIKNNKKNKKVRK